MSEIKVCSINNNTGHLYRYVIVYTNEKLFEITKRYASKDRTVLSIVDDTYCLYFNDEYYTNQIVVNRDYYIEFFSRCNIWDI